MFPVLFSIGNIPVSSFGVFLALGFLFGVFLIWRLSRAWDLNEEHVLDLTLLTFFGGLLGSRLYFVLGHPGLFAENYLKILFINKVAGFSFRGAILGGWLTLFFIARFKKMDFAKIGDIASVGFIASYIFADLGCFLGGCNVGIQSNFFAVNMVGFLGKRFPTQLLEAVLLVFVMFSLWSTAIHFHTRGKILSLSLIYVGFIKFLMEPLKQNHDEGSILSLVLLILGVTFLYKVTKRNPLTDLKSLLAFVSKLITDQATRQATLVGLKKYWYNKKTSISWKIRNLRKNLRRFNVRVS